MSDEHLRELERRWRSSGSDDDEAAWLTERVRVGDLSSRPLSQAANLGYSAARIALALQPILPESVRWGEVLWEPVLATRFILSLIERVCIEEELNRDLLPSCVVRVRLLVREWLAEQTALLTISAHACEDACEAELTMPLPSNDMEQVLMRFASLAVVAMTEPQTAIGRLLGVLSVRPVSDDQVVAHLHTWLVPWLLGYGDPLNIEKAGTP